MLFNKCVAKSIVVLGLFLVPAIEADAAQSIILSPYTPWNVDYGEKVCSLRRGFGSKEKLSAIIMHRFGPTDRFALTVVSDEFKWFNQGDNLVLRFGEGKPRRINSVIPGQKGKGIATLFFANTSLAEQSEEEADESEPIAVPPALEADTKTISIKHGSRERIFATGPLAKPFAALRACTDNLVARWGLDPKQQATLSKRVRPLSTPANWLRPSDYPASMLTSGKQALVNFRLSVDAKGSPTACEVQTSYNDKAFDEVTCSTLMRRARFSPAYDANDAAVPSFYLNTVRWIARP